MKPARLYTRIVGLGVACALAVPSASCGKPATVTTKADRLGDLAAGLDRRVAPPLIVISEPFFSGDFESHEVYQKTYSVADGLGRRGLSVVAPWEYRVHNPKASLIQGSDLVVLLRAEGVSVEDALELTVRVVSLGGSRRVDVQGGEDVLHGAQHAQPAEIRVSLRNVWTRDVVMESVTEYVEDPLSDQRSEYERLPALADALTLTLDDLVARLVDAFGDPPSAESTALFAFNPKPMFSFRHGEAPALEERFKDGDAMEQLVGKLRYYQYFDPSISVERVMDFEGMPGGILVEDPGEFGAHGLRAGDFVTKAGPTDAFGAHVLLRQTRVDTGKALTLQILRGGTPMSVVIPALTAAAAPP